ANPLVSLGCTLIVAGDPRGRGPRAGALSSARPRAEPGGRQGERRRSLTAGRGDGLLRLLARPHRRGGGDDGVCLRAVAGERCSPCGDGRLAAGHRGALALQGGITATVERARGRLDLPAARGADAALARSAVPTGCLGRILLGRILFGWILLGLGLRRRLGRRLATASDLFGRSLSRGLGGRRLFRRRRGGIDDRGNRDGTARGVGGER